MNLHTENKRRANGFSRHGRNSFALRFLCLPHFLLHNAMAPKPDWPLIQPIGRLLLPVFGIKLIIEFVMNGSCFGCLQKWPHRLIHLQPAAPANMNGIFHEVRLCPILTQIQNVIKALCFQLILHFGDRVLNHA